MSRPAWRSILMYALLVAAGVLALLALTRCDPAPDASPPPIQATPTQVTIWHIDRDGRGCVIRWGRDTTCWGPVCQPGPTVTPVHPVPAPCPTGTP